MTIAQPSNMHPPALLLTVCEQSPPQKIFSHDLIVSLDYGRYSTLQIHRIPFFLTMGINKPPKMETSVNHSSGYPVAIPILYLSIPVPLNLYIRIASPSSSEQTAHTRLQVPIFFHHISHDETPSILQTGDNLDSAQCLGRFAQCICSSADNVK